MIFLRNEEGKFVENLSVLIKKDGCKLRLEACICLGREIFFFCQGKVGIVKAMPVATMFLFVLAFFYRTYLPG